MIWMIFHLLNFTNFKLIPLYYTYQIYYCHSTNYAQNELTFFEIREMKSSNASPTIGRPRSARSNSSSGNTPVRRESSASSVRGYLERRFSNPLKKNETEECADTFIGVLPSKIIIKYFQYYVQVGLLKEAGASCKNYEYCDKTPNCSYCKKNIVLFLQNYSDSTENSAALQAKFDTLFNSDTQIHDILKYWMVFISYTFFCKPFVSFLGLGFLTNPVFECLFGLSLATSLFGNLFIKEYHSSNFLNGSFDIFVLFIMKGFTSIFSTDFNTTIVYLRDFFKKNAENEKDGTDGNLSHLPKTSESSFVGNDGNDSYNYYDMFNKVGTFVLEKYWLKTQSSTDTNNNEKKNFPIPAKSDISKDYDFVNDFIES